MKIKNIINRIKIKILMFNSKLDGILNNLFEPHTNKDVSIFRFSKYKIIIIKILIFSIFFFLTFWLLYKINYYRQFYFIERSVAVGAIDNTIERPVAVEAIDHSDERPVAVEAIDHSDENEILEYYRLREIKLEINRRYREALFMEKQYIDKLNNATNPMEKEEFSIKLDLLKEIKRDLQDQKRMQAGLYVKKRYTGLRPNKPIAPKLTYKSPALPQDEFSFENSRGTLYKNIKALKNKNNSFDTNKQIKNYNKDCNIEAHEITLSESQALRKQKLRRENIRKGKKPRIFSTKEEEAAAFKHDFCALKPKKGPMTEEDRAEFEIMQADQQRVAAEKAAEQERLDEFDRYDRLVEEQEKIKLQNNGQPEGSNRGCVRVTESKGQVQGQSKGQSKGQGQGQGQVQVQGQGQVQGLEQKEYEDYIYEEYMKKSEKIDVD